MTDIAIIDREAVQTLLYAIRRQAPLVHHITNWVTVADCAQITRSVGALPVMAHMA
ncbi:MAG: hydroxyethylthiazole kinase, partial [Desulfobacteraceae bacterium]